MSLFCSGKVLKSETRRPVPFGEKWDDFSEDDFQTGSLPGRFPRSMTARDIILTCCHNIF